MRRRRAEPEAETATRPPMPTRSPRRPMPAAARRALDVDHRRREFPPGQRRRPMRRRRRGMDGGLGLDRRRRRRRLGRGARSRRASPATTSRCTSICAARPARCLSGADLVIAEQIDRPDRRGRLFPRLARSRSPSASACRSPRSSASSASIQTFDPTGVGARNLAECLALQAKEADRYDPAMARLIDNLDLSRARAISPR